MWLVLYICFCLYVMYTVVTNKVDDMQLNGYVVFGMILGSIIIGAIQDVLNKLNKLLDN